jgi:replication factor C large subunit
VEYDDFLLSVSDNLPRRYTDADELAKAYNYISKADVYRGRIGTENWHLLKYFFNELAQAAAVNPESFKPFEFITPPIRIITLFWTKGKRNMLNAICEKIGSQCHISVEVAKEEMVPFIKMLLVKNKNHALVAWFKFTIEEVDFITKLGRF